MKSSGATGVGGVIIPMMDSKGHGVENLHFQERLCRFWLGKIIFCSKSSFPARSQSTERVNVERCHESWDGGLIRAHLEGGILLVVTPS